MAPRSFASDGAVGAADDGVGGSGASGAPTGGVTMSDPGTLAASYSGSSGGGSGFDVSPGNAAIEAQVRSGNAPPGGQMGSAPGYMINPADLATENRLRAAASPVGLAFDDGGAVEDSNGSPQQDAISKALDTVDGILAYGRKLHGLGGGSNEGAIPDAQMAQNGYQTGRMPAVPGSQSESGVPPIQPMPGPLPPTANPFGKRTADASNGSSNDGDSDDQASNQGSAIDTDEETA